MAFSKLDPICGMDGKFGAHGEVFCSVYCLRKYEEINRMAAEEPRPIQQKAPVSRLIVNGLLALFVILAVLSFFIRALFPFNDSLFAFLYMVAPAFALGLVLGGLVDVFVPREVITRLLAQGGSADIFRAGFLGFAASTCSHGCLALSMELHKKGASGPSVLTFLLASPWASLPVTFLLLRLFGWKGLLIVGLAFLVAITTGLIAQKLAKAGLLEPNPRTMPLGSESARMLIRKSWQENKKPSVLFPKLWRASASLLQMTAPWILIGVFLASLISSYLPASVGPWLGKGLSGPPLSMALASMMEVCSEGSAPLAFGIYTAGGAALGSAYTFLEAGVVTDFNEISLVWANLGKKSAWAMIALALPQVLFYGYLLNLLF